jgi:hypothetical protein
MSGVATAGAVHILLKSVAASVGGTVVVAVAGVGIPSFGPAAGLLGEGVIADLMVSKMLIRYYLLSFGFGFGFG